jgi:hypothetical protein
MVPDEYPTSTPFARYLVFLYSLVQVVCRPDLTHLNSWVTTSSEEKHGIKEHSLLSFMFTTYLRH